MVNANDIRSAIGDYLAGNFSFDDFENWMIVNTREINKWGDSATKSLAYSVDLRIAEYLISEDSKITEKDLRSELQALANTYPQAQLKIVIVSGTSTYSTAPLVLKNRPVGTLLSTASSLLTLS